MDALRANLAQANDDFEAAQLRYQAILGKHTNSLSDFAQAQRIMESWRAASGVQRPTTKVFLEAQAAFEEAKQAHRQSRAHLREVQKEMGGVGKAQNKAWKAVNDAESSKSPSDGQRDHHTELEKVGSKAPLVVDPSSVRAATMSTLPASTAPATSDSRQQTGVTAKSDRQVTVAQPSESLVVDTAMCTGDEDCDCEECEAAFYFRPT